MEGRVHDAAYFFFFTPGRAGLQLTAAAIYVVLSADRLLTDVNHVFRA